MKHVEVRRGAYVDSVTLMQVSKQVAGLDGVGSALVAMTTDLNLDLAASMGFEVPDGLSGNEMLVALEVDSEETLASATSGVDAALSAATRPAAAGFGSAPQPATVAAAARGADPQTAVAVISTPGQYAFADALDAVEAGLHTMVFSDNVPVEQEVRLKDRAAERGVLLMGPDCGTAVVGGVGLGFANVVRPGPVGIVAASGTGAQHLMALLDAADIGISHCLGVGGRDLSEEVAARSTLRALELLEDDEGTELVLVVSKPPARSVEQRVREHAESMRTPVRFGLLGPGRPDLTETARGVVETVGGTWSAPGHWDGAVTRGRAGGTIRGLFAGGTLCDEARLVVESRLGADAGVFVDFGDDEYTRGRPHPMIDGSLRIERMLTEVDDPGCGVLLLDVVLGLGADADPSAGLVEPVRKAVAADLPVVVSVVGTRDDPQDTRRQCRALHEAGASVHLSNAAAAHTAAGLIEGGAR